MAEDFLTETFDFVNREGLQELWQRAKRKFFVKTDNIAGTEYDGVDANLKALSEITSGETSSDHKLGLVRRTNGAPANTWVLDDTKYVIGASISADGITLDRMNPDGTEEETGKPLISMSSIKTAIGLKSAAYLEANNTAGNIPLLDSNGHLSIGVIPDAILGQVLFGGTVASVSGGTPVIPNANLTANAKAKIEQKTGKTIGTRDIYLVNVKQSQAGTWTSGVAYVGYDACEGIYFIWSSNAQTTFAGEQYNVGDWCISTGGAWKKVDNTDAVTGIKFLKNGTYSTVDIGEVIVSCDKIGALDLFATTPQNMLGDLIVGTSSSRKSISAYGGVAAHGIGDLTSGGGGGGTSGVSIMRDWANYDGTDETQVLGTNLAKAMKDNVTSKGDATHPVYFNANGVAVQINSYAGNAATASALATARNITIGNKTLSFDGSANISFSLAEIGAQAVIADVSDSVNGYVSKVMQTNGKIGVTHATFAKPAITLSATKMKITTDGGNSDEVTIPTWNQDTTGKAGKVANALAFGNKTYDGSAAVSLSLADLATFANNKYAINISGKADTAGTADKVAHKLTIQKNGTAIGSAFDGSGSDMTINIDDVASADTLATEITERKAADVNKVMIGGIKTRQSATPAMIEATSQTDANSALRFVRSVNDSTHVDIPRGTDIDINATNIIGEALPQTNQQFNSRTTAGTANIKDTGVVHISRMMGQTIVWNQMINHFVSQETREGITCSQNGIGVMEFSGISTGQTTFQFSSSGYKFIKDHKYLLKGISNGSENSYRLWFMSNTAFPLGHRLICTNRAIIITALADETLSANAAYCQIMKAGIDMSGIVIKPLLFDLTQMFRAGNEPATVAEFETLYDRSYYSYNVGKLLSVGAERKVFTQVLQHGNFADTNNWSEISSVFTIDNGIASVKKTEATIGGLIIQNISIDTTHKYYYSCYAKSTDSNYRANIGFHASQGAIGGNSIVVTTNTDFTRLSNIASPVKSSDIFALRAGDSSTPINFTCYFHSVVVFDLTATFGAGNEPDTVMEVEQWLKNKDGEIPYYEYNVATELDYDVELEEIGTNLWDEEWEVGSYDTTEGKKVTRADAIRSKNYIPVLPNTSYYFKCASHQDSRDGVTLWYDADKKYITFTFSPLNTTKSSPANARYMTFYIAPETTYNHDICINLSWSGQRDGNYYPYERHTLPAPFPKIEPFEYRKYALNELCLQYPSSGGSFVKSNGYALWKRTANGGVKRQWNESDWTMIRTAGAGVGQWLSAGTAYDYCESGSWDIDGKHYNAHARIVMGAVDMGTLNYNISYDVYCIAYIVGRAVKPNSANGICDRYICHGNTIYDASFQPNTISMGANDNRIIYKADHTVTSEEVKSLLNGATLYYELAEPIDLYYNTNWDCWCDDYGMERWLPEQTRNPRMLMPIADMTYGINARDDIKQLPAKYLQKENFNIYADAHSSMEIHEDAQTADVTAMTIKIGDKEVDLVALTQAEIQAICN